MRIRQGNDFIFLWAIERNGEPEDFSNAVNIKLHFKNFDCVGEVKSFQIVDGNIVRVEVSPEWASRLGAYRLILSYEFEDLSYSDGDQKCVVDVLAFNIVPKTSEADDLTEMAKTTDIMIGLSGLSAYEVWSKDNPDSTKEDYYNWLRQPATDAVSLIDDKIEHLDEVIDSSTANEAERVGAETLRVQNENLRISAETERKANEVERLANEASRASDELTREANESTREQDEATRKTNESERETAELTRQSSESERNEAEGLRVDAEIVREQQEQARQANTAIAITNAENAIVDVNTAKDDYYDVVKPAIQAQGDYAQAQGDYAKAQGEAIQDDLALKANHGYASIEVAKTLKEVDDNASVKIENLIVNGDFRADTPRNISAFGWYPPTYTFDTTIKKVNLRSLKCEANRSDVRTGILKSGLSTTDKYYFAGWIYANGNGQTSLIKSNTGAGVGGTNKNHSINQWAYRSFVHTSSTGFLGIVTSDIGTGNAIWFDGFKLINLTETFGAGNEPTKEEFELLLATLGVDYFEGEITIPAQKIMQWQLKLIRKNKNAIIALGGTII